MPLHSVISIMFEMLHHEQLRRLRGTSRELCAVVSKDHGWSLKYHEMVDGFELFSNEMVVPAYPEPERGDQRDEFSFFPIDPRCDLLEGFVFPYPFQIDTHLRMKDGILQDLFHPELEPANTFDNAKRRTGVYFARPLPLRCLCCAVECDSYVSFTEHCTLQSHKNKLDPSTTLDPRFIHERYNDPRHNADFDELSMMLKCRAMDHYKFHMKCFFLLSRPMHKIIKAPRQSQHEAWKNMKGCAKLARLDVTYNNGFPDDTDEEVISDSDEFPASLEFGLPDVELRAICLKCTPDRAVDVWVRMIIEDFKGGLQGAALEVVQRGWIRLSSHGGNVHQQRRFMVGMTGLAY
jgi:hypothetical protein